MEDKHKLTEDLKVIETVVYNHKIDLSSLNRKLENSYKYEDELLQRLESARNETKELRQMLFLKMAEISKQYDTMKSILDIHTGNFYNHEKFK